MQSLSEIPGADQPPCAPAKPPGILRTFYPYPNENSFRLGEWYWAGGQKSQESFSDLINIVSSPTFRPEDVRGISWDKINAQLTKNMDDTEDGEWLEEDVGWKKSPISISVPFNRRYPEKYAHPISCLFVLIAAADVSEFCWPVSVT